MQDTVETFCFFYEASTRGLARAGTLPPVCRRNAAFSHLPLSHTCTAHSRSIANAMHTFSLLSLLLLPLAVLLSAPGAALAMARTRGLGAPPPPLAIHWLGADTEARCMDGSRFGYYFRPASGASGAKKWVIELQGMYVCAHAQWNRCRAVRTTAPPA